MSQAETTPQAAPISYFIEAYAPDPRNNDGYFSYCGEVSRSKLIDSGQDYEFFLEGLAAHFFAQTGVKCLPNSIRLHRIELVRDDLFPLNVSR